MTTLKNGAELIHDYTDANSRIVIGHWSLGDGAEYIVWYCDADGHAFNGSYFSYRTNDEYGKVRALRMAFTEWCSRIDDARAFAD